MLWFGSLASIPTGWRLCDGNEGTPNLLSKFLEGIATALTKPGATGGVSTHTHTVPDHGDGVHSYPTHTHTCLASTLNPVNTYTGASSVCSGNHTHGASSTTKPALGNAATTISTDSNLPAYRTAAFIMKV